MRKARPSTAAPKLARAPKPKPTGREPDAVVREATGRGWAQWFRLLDRLDAASVGRNASVRHLAEVHECPRWWRQRIVQAHAEARGLGEPSRRSLAANTSRTVAVGVEDLYRAWRGRGPHKWLLGARFKVQRANENRSLRLGWPDRTSVEIYFWAKGERRSQVNVMHRRLASAEEVSEMKQFWTRALDQLQAVLE